MKDRSKLSAAEFARFYGVSRAGAWRILSANREAPGVDFVGKRYSVERWRADAWKRAKEALP